METKESNIHNVRPRKAVLIGDMALINGLIKAPLLSMMFGKKRTEIVIRLTVTLVRFVSDCFAAMHWSVLRVRPGAGTVGLLSTTLCLSFLLSYNAQSVTDPHKVMAVFITPLTLYQQPVDQWVELFIVNVESRGLLIYTGLFGLINLIHIAMIWIGKGSESTSQRGSSILGLIIGRWIKPNAYFIEGWIEPLLASALGLMMWHEVQDVHFALLLWVSAGCEWLQQLIDHAHQMHVRTLLNA